MAKIPGTLTVDMFPDVPCGITVKTSEEDRKAIYAKIEEIDSSLKHLDVRVKADIRDTYSPGWKFNQYELKVP